MKIYLLFISAFLLSVPSQGQTPTEAQSTGRVAGIYLYGDLMPGTIRGINGNRLQSPLSNLGFGYFRQMENGNELHVTAGMKGVFENNFFGLSTKAGVQYRMYAKSLWKGRIQPYLGIGGGMNATVINGTNLLLFGPFSRSIFLSPYMGVYPGMKVAMGKNFFLDISAPVEWSPLHFAHQGGNGINETRFEFRNYLPRPSLRLGLGINFELQPKK